MLGSISCCGKKKTKASFAHNRFQLEKQYQKNWRFNDEELFEFTKRFESYAVNHRLSHKNYRESLGIIGIESLSFLCDRMFKVMDRNNSGFIMLDQYLNYIDILLYGTEEEKLQQSFDLLDDLKRGHIIFEDFRKIINSFAQMWSAALGQPKMINNPDMLFWFSKPEKAINKRLNENLQELQQQKDFKIKEQVEGLIKQFHNYNEQILARIQQCIETMNGIMTPEQSQERTLANSPNKQQFQSRNLIQRKKTWHMPNNQLFMNINGSSLQNMEFPNNDYQQAILSPKDVNKNKHTQFVGPFKHPMNKLTKKSQKRRSILSQRNHLSTQQMNKFEAIKEEDEKLMDRIGASTNQNNGHRKIGSSHQKELREFMKNVGGELTKYKKNKIFSNQQFQEQEQDPDSEKINGERQFQLSAQQQEESYQYKNKKQSSGQLDKGEEIKLQSRQSNIIKSMGSTITKQDFEGGEKEDKNIDEEDKVNNEEQQINQNKNDDTLNENDVNLEFSQNGTANKNHDQQQIRFEANPMYPGKIFYIEDQEENLVVNESDIEDIDEDEDDSLLTSSDEQEGIGQENFVNLKINDNQKQTLIKKIYDLNQYLIEKERNTNVFENRVVNQQKWNNNEIQSQKSMQSYKSNFNENNLVKKQNSQYQIQGPGSYIKKQTSQLNATTLPDIIGNQYQQTKPNKNIVQPCPPFGSELDNIQKSQVFLENIRNNIGVSRNNVNYQQSIKAVLANSGQIKINQQLDTNEELLNEENIKEDENQNFKQQNQGKKVSVCKKMLNQLIRFMGEEMELINNHFKQLLNFEGDDQQNKMNDIDFRQNVPINTRGNRILKQQSNMPDKVKLIHPAHQNFNLVFNIMLGIKKAIDSTYDIPLIDFTDKDFKIRCKYELAPYRIDTKDNIKACTFFDYAPQIFSSIRKTFGIRKQKYSESLGPEHILGYMFNANFKTLAELCTSGKSGSFFYYTSDARFVLKTISRHEFKYLKKILKNYHNYVTQENPDTLISKIFGLHKVIFYRKKGKMSKKLYFSIMNNIFYTNKKIDYRYDLKGSTQGRQTQAQGSQEVDPTIALKDNDFLMNNKKFIVGGDQKKRLMEIITLDSQFFAKNQIIDYSLLIGVHNKNDHPSPTNQSRLNSMESDYNSPTPYLPVIYQERYSTQLIMNKDFYQLCELGVPSYDRKLIFFVGIIDILTEYSAKKKLEHVLKSLKYPSATISCVPPQQYSERFISFIKDAFQ